MTDTFWASSAFIAICLNLFTVRLLVVRRDWVEIIMDSYSYR
jgi:hypothetical protein